MERLNANSGSKWGASFFLSSRVWKNSGLIQLKSTKRCIHHRKREDGGSYGITEQIYKNHSSKGGIILKKYSYYLPLKWCKFSFWSPLIVPYYVDFWLMVLEWIFKIPETLLYFNSIFITCISPLERSTAPFYNSNFVTVLAGKDFQKYLFSKGNLCKIFLTQLNLWYTVSIQ